jgi:cysteinyl-tRNA synthetase
MSQKSLGEVFDIHGGGLDLIFPHHENEIAQSRCAHGTKVMANYWMHNGFLQVEGKKMSKSEGNFYTIQQLLSSNDFGGRNWSGAVLRLAMLMANYREPIDFTKSRLEEAEAVLASLHWGELLKLQKPERLSSSDVATMFIYAANDDLNTYEMIRRMRDANRTFNYNDAVLMLDILGLWDISLELRSSAVQLSETKREQIVRLVEDRLLARHNKDWKESDRIRDELAAMGIAIKDNKDGTTTWEVKR